VNAWCAQRLFNDCSLVLDAQDQLYSGYLVSKAPMLTSLRLQNFKSWGDTGQVRLAPLTVIFGGNSAGKSSLGHLLLALKQTVLSADRKRALNLGDSTTLIDLGTFADCLHNHDAGLMLGFELGWSLPKALDISDALMPIKRKRITGNAVELKASIAMDGKTGQPETRGFRYQLKNKENEIVLTAELKTEMGSVSKTFDLTAKGINLVRVSGRGWPLEAPEKFYRLSEVSLARYQNADFLTDFALATETALRGVAYLGPLREPPKRMYQWSGDTPEDVGQRGEFATVALLSAEREERMLKLPGVKKLQRFSEVIASQLQRLGVIESFSVSPVAANRKEYEVLVRTTQEGAEVKITDVGVGVSQVLPALVEAFYCPPNSTVWMEQPEIHLHPQVQAELADVFITAVQARENRTPRNIQLVIESHSEHFLNRLQRRIAEGKIKPEDVAIYFASRTSNATALEPLRLNQYGDIENWPDNFFGDDMADLTARTLAAAKRRQGAQS